MEKGLKSPTDSINMPKRCINKLFFIYFAVKKKTINQIQ